MGYFTPAEWEPHSDTWLAWPHNLKTWSKHELYAVENVYIEIIRNLIEGERINILINDEHFQHKITTLLHREKINIGSIRFHKIPTNDAWIRDFGPNFLVRESVIGRQIGVNRWRFNSWGEKYPWEIDNEANRPENLDNKIVVIPAADPGWEN